MLGDHNTLYREIGIVPNNTPADYKNLEECIWLKEVDSLALANVQLNLNQAFQIKIDKWFPSSKTCSECGYVHKKTVAF